ncbi:MAG: type II secretion system protein [Bryobacterales bacterium]
MVRQQQPRRITRRDAGLTLIELIVAFTVLLILSTMALPLMTVRVQREKERRLRMALEEIRTRDRSLQRCGRPRTAGEQDPTTMATPRVWTSWWKAWK